jgi:1-deoxy-D-xylulose-5-phosphate reductoisomerase
MMPGTGQKRIIVLGATGSIGSGAIDVIREHPDKFRLVGLSAHSNEAGLMEIAGRFDVPATCLSGAGNSSDRATYSGSSGLLELVEKTDADIVLNAIAGRPGLESSIAALSSGKDLALANKETMVCAGALVKDIARKNGKRILPVDSEHSAVFQLINSIGIGKIEEIVLTASGGPFRDFGIEQFASIRLEDALKHPNWSMGKKITIDSATMANKGLEVIEAQELFDIPLTRIQVIIHRESRVHSLVRSTDGSLYAQISKPDMRVPIQNALSFPDLMACPFGRLDLAGERLSFDAPDLTRFPLLGLGYQAAAYRGFYPLAFNAANEIAVEQFIGRRIGFTQIAEVVEDVLSKRWDGNVLAFEDILRADGEARRIACESASQRKNP